jgi:CubicO group peptidase (beta-lactamase class C family)
MAQYHTAGASWPTGVRARRIQLPEEAPPVSRPPLQRPILQPFLAELAASGAVSAVTALVGTAEEVTWSGSAGLARPDPPGQPADLDTRFDLGSLTKPFVATLALALDAAGELPLALPVGEVWPGADPRLARLPLADLLSHRAGFAAWAPLYARCGSRDEVLALLLGGELLGEAPGTYSDLDYILWARAAEERLGRPLWDLLSERVLVPLGLSTVTLAPGDTGEAANLALSRMGTGKEVELAAEEGRAIADLGPPAPGEVQDGNGRFLRSSGVALPGNAGLFGRARDLWTLGVEWLRPGRLLSPVAKRAALSYGDGLYALGWVRRNVAGSAGPVIGSASFGHSGFAGGSLWIDPDRERILVLLGARTDPAVDLNLWRRRFHALAYDEGSAEAP